MKRIASLLAVAALAITFGAACGKHSKCEQATTEVECKDAKKFEDNVKCKWDKDATSSTGTTTTTGTGTTTTTGTVTKGKCVAAGTTTTGSTTSTTSTTTSDADLCKAANADKAACDAATATLTDKTKSCDFDATAKTCTIK